MCWKEIINHNWLKKFCSICRKKRDDELSKKNLQSKNKKCNI